MPGDYFCSSFSVLLLLVMVEKMLEVVPLIRALTSWANVKLKVLVRGILILGKRFLKKPKQTNKQNNLSKQTSLKIKGQLILYILSHCVHI